MRNLTNRPLGRRQKSCLNNIADWGAWHPGCGWTWNTKVDTTLIMESLRKRGLVRRIGRSYFITPKGRNAIA